MSIPDPPLAAKESVLRVRCSPGLDLYAMFALLLGKYDAQESVLVLGFNRILIVHARKNNLRVKFAVWNL